MEATETPLTTWETEKPKLLKKHYHVLQEVTATVGRLPGDGGDLPHAAADVGSGSSWHLWAPGKRTNEGPHSIRFKYLREINQTSKLLNKICSMLPPWQNTFIMTAPPPNVWSYGIYMELAKTHRWLNLNTEHIWMLPWWAVKVEMSNTSKVIRNTWFIIYICSIVFFPSLQQNH